MSLPFSQACENNKQAILAVLKNAFISAQSVLEVGSGTGQHAVYFARQLSHLNWQPSDQGDYLPAAKARVSAEPSSNLALPVHFNVIHSAPSGQFDALFTANTFHIMPSSAVELFFKHFGNDLSGVKVLCIYGPFKVTGEHTSDSNYRFDLSLRDQQPNMGIRDREWIITLAAAQGFELCQAHAMPANNQLLEFRR